MRLRQTPTLLKITYLSVLLLLSAIAVCLGQPGNDPKTLFYEANTAYSKGNYAQAIQLYQQTLGSGYQSGNLYYNLGNSYFKAGQTGKAILYYEKAQRLIPGDADLKANLSYARKNVNEMQPRWPKQLWYFLVSRLSLEQAWLYTSISLFLLAGLLASCIGWPEITQRFKPWPQLSSALCGGLLLVILLIAICTGIEHSHPAAVAIQSGGTARFEPNSQAALHFNLVEGTQVYLREQQNGWSLVERRDGVKGWVENCYLQQL